MPSKSSHEAAAALSPKSPYSDRISIPALGHFEVAKELPPKHPQKHSAWAGVSEPDLVVCLGAGESLGVILGGLGGYLGPLGWLENARGPSGRAPAKSWCLGGPVLSIKGGPEGAFETSGRRFWGLRGAPGASAAASTPRSKPCPELSRVVHKTQKGRRGRNITGTDMFRPGVGAKGSRNIIGTEMFRQRPLHRGRVGRLPGAGFRFGEALNPGPLHIRAKLHELEVNVLVDTGSDDDAIHAGFSRLQEVKYANPAFVDRRETEKYWVGGYCQDMQNSSSHESDWMITVEGRQTYGSRIASRTVRRTFTEFENLGDPLILGLPTIDEFGGIETTLEDVWTLGVWVPRAPTTPAIGSLRSGSVHHRASGVIMRATRIDNRGDYAVTLGFQASELHEQLGWTQAWWLESDDIELDIVNAPVTPFDADGCVTLTAFARVKGTWGAERHLPVDTRVAAMRQMTPEDAFYAREHMLACQIGVPDDRDSGNTATATPHQATVVTVPHGAEVVVASCPETLPVTAGAVGRDTTGRISGAAYKTKQRTNEQASLFPELLEEIDARRGKLHQPKYDQKSDEYRALLRNLVKEKELVPPDILDEFCERILYPFSDRFWHEGCEAPRITNFVAHIEPKKDAVFKCKQPYTLSKYDQARLVYLLEEEEAEGKLIPLGAGDLGNNDRKSCLSPGEREDSRSLKPSPARGAHPLTIVPPEREQGLLVPATGETSTRLSAP